MTPDPKSCPHCLARLHELSERHDELEAMTSRAVKLEEGLHKVVALGGLTMLCDPADFDFNAEDAYSAGAENAFWEAAEVAKDALRDALTGAADRGRG